MVDECSEGDWLSRRDSRIRAPIESITRTSRNGVTYLAPHVQLYYKAKSPRAKDQIDFDVLMESVISMDVEWLRNAISLSYGTSHPWLASLPE